MARVRRTETGTFQLDPLFVPPLLNFNASDYLAGIARQLVEILTRPLGAISGFASRQKNQSLADFTSADIAIWLLYIVNTAFPLPPFVRNPDGHPEELFAALLCSLVFPVPRPTSSPQQHKIP